MPNYEETCYNKDSNWITGEVQDVIIDKDGNRTELPKDHNLVVTNCSILIAALLKSHWGNSTTDATKRSGIRYWAIGTGANPDSDAPSSSDVGLAKEAYRQEITPDNITFVTDTGEASPDGAPTRRLKITILVDYNAGNITEDGGDGVAEWTEFGIFAGPEATETLGSGMMINRKIHGRIAKTENIKVERTLIFTF